MVYLTLHNPFLLSCTWGMHMLPGTQVKTKIHKCFVKTPSQKLLDVKRLLEWFRVTCLINKGYHCLSKTVEHFIVFYLKIYYFPLWFLWIVPCGYVRQRQGKKQRYFPSCYSMGHITLYMQECHFEPRRQIISKLSTN